eukprot:scaffold14519_cov135-Isochrysis_galbana.AAC.4
MRPATDVARARNLTRVPGIESSHCLKRGRAHQACGPVRVEGRTGQPLVDFKLGIKPGRLDPTPRERLLGGLELQHEGESVHWDMR